MPGLDERFYTNSPFPAIISSTALSLLFDSGVGWAKAGLSWARESALAGVASPFCVGVGVGVVALWLPWPLRNKRCLKSSRILIKGRYRAAMRPCCDWNIRPQFCDQSCEIVRYFWFSLKVMLPELSLPLVHSMHTLDQFYWPWCCLSLRWPNVVSTVAA